MKNFLLNLLFPPQCLGCKVFDTRLCEACFYLIRPNRTQCCYICRKPNEDGRTCSVHSRNDNSLDGLIVAAHYDGNPILKKAISELKYKRYQTLAPMLAKLFPKNFIRNSELIPVPLHKNRMKKRGFNQAELLACTISPILIRIRDIPSQVECRDRQTRLNNPKGAFALNGMVDPETTYVLVDDLVTTGATLEECCRVLKASGAKTVWGLVLARN